VIDGYDQFLSSRDVAYVRHKFPMIFEPSLVRQVVPEIGLVENNARRFELSEQSFVVVGQLGMGLQPDEEVIADSGYVVLGHLSAPSSK
jgi:hypothetical protein